MRVPFFFIVAKVEHSAWYEGESLEKKFGFPGDKKSVWKSAIIPLETTGALSEGDIKVYRNNSSKYWTDKFLEVQEKNQMKQIHEKCLKQFNLF